MELFIDKYYNEDVENKIDYNKVLYGTDSGTDFNFFNETPLAGYYFFGGKVIFAFGSNIDRVKVIKDGIYAQEFRISDRCKKFIIHNETNN